MILVTSSNKPFSFTAKGTPRRQAIINEYEEEINQLYDSIEESAQIDISAPDRWTAQSTYTFVRSVVLHVIKGRDITDDDDLFEHGGDRYSFVFED